MFILSFFARPNPSSSSGETKKGALCGGVSELLRNRNHKSAAKFFPRLQKLLTLLIYYTHTRSLILAKARKRHFPTPDNFYYHGSRDDVLALN